MAYSEDSVNAKLNALNDTQESIVVAAQWILFHRRYADRTVSLWLSRLQEASVPKKLNLVYLANEVVQQSRARGKTEFMIAFEPIIADAMGIAYRHASQDIQGKLKRVVEVWRQRKIFDPHILDAIEGRLKEMDAARKGGAGRANGGSRLGGSLFGGGGGDLPRELEGVAKAQAAVSKAETGVIAPTAAADSEYEKMTDPEAVTPTPPVHAARLSALVRTLATAQNAVEASIKARRDLVTGLEKLLQTSRQKLDEEEAKEAELQMRKDSIEAKKREVEDAIMRGLSNPSTPAASTPTGSVPSPANGTKTSDNEPAAPEPEAFTPPPPDVEAFTPPAADADAELLIGDTGELERLLSSTTGGEKLHETPPNFSAEPPPAFEPPPALQADSYAAIQATDFLNSLSLPHANKSTGRSASGEAPVDDPRLKRRKTTHHRNEDLDADIFGQNGMSGVDEDGVAAMLDS